MSCCARCPTGNDIQPPSWATELRVNSMSSESGSIVLTPVSLSSHSFNEGTKSCGGRGAGKGFTE